MSTASSSSKKSRIPVSKSKLMRHMLVESASNACKTSEEMRLSILTSSQMQTSFNSDMSMEPIDLYNDFYKNRREDTNNDLLISHPSSDNNEEMSLSILSASKMKCSFGSTVSSLLDIDAETNAIVPLNKKSNNSKFSATNVVTTTTTSLTSTATTKTSPTTTRAPRKSRIPSIALDFNRERSQSSMKSARATQSHSSLSKKGNSSLPKDFQQCLEHNAKGFEAMAILVDHLWTTIKTTVINKNHQDRFRGDSHESVAILQHQLAEVQHKAELERRRNEAEMDKLKQYIKKAEQEHRCREASLTEQRLSDLMEQDRVHQEQLNFNNEVFVTKLMSVKEESKNRMMNLVEEKNERIGNLEVKCNQLRNELKETQAKLKAMKSEQVKNKRSQNRSKGFEMEKQHYLKTMNDLRAEVDSYKTVFELKSKDLSKLRIEKQILMDKLELAETKEIELQSCRQQLEQTLSLLETKTEAERNLEQEVLRLRQRLRSWQPTQLRQWHEQEERHYKSLVNNETENGSVSGRNSPSHYNEFGVVRRNNSVSWIIDAKEEQDEEEEGVSECDSAFTLSSDSTNYHNYH